MMKFPCGCEYDSNNFDPFKLNWNCPKTWELIGRGLTYGVFQLESELGKQWVQKLKPDSLEDMAALGSILRPGALKSVDEKGISTTAHFCKRKNGQETVESNNPAIDKVLHATYNCMIYQEQILQLAQAVAGFDLQQADILRKCVSGKTKFVSKTRGWISINELLKSGYENDEFLVMDELGSQSWSKIEKIWSTGQNNVKRVKLDSGMYVDATKYHKFLTSKGWKARARLQIQDYIISTEYIDYDGKDEISEDLAIVIAGLLTEGYFVKNNKGATFVNYNKFMLDTFADSYYQTFKIFPKLVKSGTVLYINTKCKKEIARYMSYGLSQQKYIPDAMMRMTKETTRKFLSFMLSAEGGISKSGQFEFSSKSKKMIEQVQLLLMRFGIYSYIHKRKVKGYTNNYYRLYINDLIDQKKLLKELTCLWQKDKLDSLISIIDKKSHLNYSSHHIPHHLLVSMIDEYPTCIKGSDASGSVYTQDISKTKFKRLAIKTSSDKWIDLSNGKQRYAKIKEINNNPAGKKIETFDFTMGNHSTPYIIANGMVISNSIGKKLPEVMAKCKKEFVAGVEKTKVISKEEGDKLFDDIEKSQRYIFNKSHSVAYGILGYICAWLKAHFPLEFYCGWLKRAKDKNTGSQDEVASLVNEAKALGVEVLPPLIQDLKSNFYIKDNKVFFGLANIKGISDNTAGKALIKWKNIPAKLSWYEMLTKHSEKVGGIVFTALIRVGGLRGYEFGMDRAKMVTEYGHWTKLTDREKTYIRSQKFDNLYDAISSLLSWTKTNAKDEVSNVLDKNRTQIVKSLLSIIKNPPFDDKDNSTSIADQEQILLGVPVSGFHLDDYDTSVGNCCCADILRGEVTKGTLPVIIKDVRIHLVKKGKSIGEPMAFLKVIDHSGGCDSVVVFPDTYKKFKELFVIDNKVALFGYYNGSFIVQGASLLRYNHTNQ